jgi:clan AA aspartic protease (TIGR02281 family)
MSRPILFGEIPGIKEGDWFEGRKEMMPTSFHRRWGSGIDGNKREAEDNNYELERLNAIYCRMVLLLFSMFIVASLSSQTVVQMTRSGGVSLIPCKVNGLNLNFIYDTGASDVSLSLTEAGFMLKNGYLAESDFVGTQNYSDANGDIEEGVVINLRSIIIGGLLIKNVQATIVKNTKAPLLLGQSALSRLGIVQQDFVKNTLTIYNNGSVPKAPTASTPPKAVTNKLEIVITDEDGDITKFSIVPLSRITTKPKPDIKYFWYNQDNNSIESTVGEWGGPLLNGFFRVFSVSGGMSESGFFVNGLRHGIFKEFDNDGVLVKIKSFKSGSEIYTNVRYERLVYYFDSSYHKNGFAWWKEDLSKKTDTIFYHDLVGQLYRIRINMSLKYKVFEFWPNGKTRRRFQCWDNYATHQRYGEYVEYYDNGNLKVKGRYLDDTNFGYHFDGLPTGKWQVYKKDGKLRNTISFRRDTIYSSMKDTIWIGLNFHDRFSTDSLARIGWQRVDDWHEIIVSQPGTYGIIEYPKWRPESIGDYHYPEFLIKDNSEEGLVEFRNLLIWYDDYSQFLQIPHIFE